MALEHPLAIEVLYRVQPHVLRERHVCCFYHPRGAIETEMHVLLDYADPRLLALRASFWTDTRQVLGPVLDEWRWRWSSIQLLDVLLSRDYLCTRFAHYVAYVFSLVDTVPVLYITDQATYLALSP